MHGPVMAPAQQHQVRQRCLPAVRPVAHVVRIAPGCPAAGEAAVPVAGGQRAPQGRRDGARAAAHAENLAGRTVPHRDLRGVAGQPPGRLGTDVDAARLVERRLAAGGGRDDRAAGPRRLVRRAGSRRARFVRSRGNVQTGLPASGVAGRVRPASVAGNRVRGGCVQAGSERVDVHVHDHLIAVAGRALVEPAGQRALGHRSQRIRPPLRRRRRAMPPATSSAASPAAPVRPRLAPLGVERPPHGGGPPRASAGRAPTTISVFVHPRSRATARRAAARLRLPRPRGRPAARCGQSARRAPRCRPAPRRAAPARSRAWPRG